MLNVTLCPWPIDGFFLHQESKERLWLVRERKVPFCCSKKESPHNGVPIPTRAVCPLLTGHGPTYPAVGGVVAHEMKTLSCAGAVVRLRIALVRPSSRSLYPAPSCGGLVRDLVFFFLLRMSLVSLGSVGSFWEVHSASSGSAWYAFFALV